MSQKLQITKQDTGRAATGCARNADLHWPAAFLAAGLAGSIGAVLFIPLFGAGLGMICGGVLAVVLYRPGKASALLTSNNGVMLGVLSAFAESGIFIACIWLRISLFHSAGPLRGVFAAVLERAAVFLDIEVAPRLIKATGSPLGLVAFLVSMLIVLSTCASVGCTIGAIFLWRSRKVAVE